MTAHLTGSNLDSASTDQACAAQSPAPTEHSSKLISADDHRRVQNRKHAAEDCRARRRSTLVTAQQEVRNSVAKMEFWKACISELPSGPSMLARCDQAAMGRAPAASSDEACAAQSPASTEHSGKRKRISADDHLRAQNRKHAANCRARQRSALVTAQQEVRDNAAKIEFLQACCSALPCGPSILAKFDLFATNLL
jgi:homoserine kinase